MARCFAAHSARVSALSYLNDRAKKSEMSQRCHISDTDLPPRLSKVES